MIPLLPRTPFVDHSCSHHSRVSEERLTHACTENSFSNFGAKTGGKCRCVGQGLGWMLLALTLGRACSS